MIGGGPIGLELAQAYRRLGARVTVLEAADFLAKDDPELAAIVVARLRAEGVDLRAPVKIARVERATAGMAVILDGGERLEGSHLLVAAGRAPIIEGLDLEKAGVAHTRHGITVDASLRNSNRNVWAIGDCNGLYAFTHMAGYEASLFIRGALFRAARRGSTPSLVPWATYTDPELAQVGMSEREARDKHGEAIKVLRWKLAENDRAQTERDDRGHGQGDHRPARPHPGRHHRGAACRRTDPTLARSGFADPLDGHEREVSILLVDLAGFTSFSNRPDLSASDIVRIANRYFTLMQGTIDRYGGCSDKFLGDAVLAFWNGLSDEPEHALKALAAGSEIIRAVGHAKESENNLLAARAVVCSGKVYVGDLGAKQRSNFTIIGPAVNETFRLEKVPDMYGLSLLVAGSAAKLIETSKSSAQSMGLLENSALVRIDDVELKGFEGPRPIYALVPRNDPGLANFQAGRNALDQKMFCEARTHLKAVDSGMLQAAAKTLLQRIDETTLLGSESVPGM